MSGSRFARQIPFLSASGQARLTATRIAVVGAGGLGSHVVQQLAYLGVTNLALIDHDIVEETNLNRLVTAVPADIGDYKVNVLRRFVTTLDPSAKATSIRDEIRSFAAFSAIKSADYLVGCVDDDGPRFLMNQLSAAYCKPYLDLATELGPDRTSFGGRIAFVRPGEGCLWCRDLLDSKEVQTWLESAGEQETRERIYGQTVRSIAGGGPAVVALNGTIASLGVMELMLEIAGIRAACPALVYRGVFGVVAKPEEASNTQIDCRICQEVLGCGDAADLDRFIREHPKRNNS